MTDQEAMEAAYINAADGPNPSEPHFRMCEHTDEQHEAFTAGYRAALSAQEESP